MKIRTISIFCVITLFFSVASWRIYDIALNSDVTAAGQYTTSSLTVWEPRGNIYDRNGNKLVGTQNRYVAAVSPNLSTINEINKKLGKAATTALEMLSGGKPTVIDATADFSCDESILFRVPVRYSTDQLAAHLIGYADLSGHGVTGVELAYDDLLTAEEPVTVTYTVDATGRPLSGVEPAVSGTTDVKTGVILTIDSALQKIAEQAAPDLGTGTVIIMDPSSGDILAMASVPDYSPLNVAASLNNSSAPLVNRALASYNVGSVFKILVAAAALDGGVSAQFENTCTGSVKIGENLFGCHEYGGHGTIDMKKALCGSCNPYFISLAERIGGEKILTLCENLGFGTKRAIANNLFTAESTLPKKETVTAQPAALANFAFGQGELLLTPVDVAVMTAMIANGGYAVTPKAVGGVMLADGGVKEYYTDKPRRVISENAAKSVAEMMCAVVSEGTGGAAMPNVGGAGGKTATAEAGYKVDDQKVNQCWFSGFYPAENPKYVITVVGENGESGAKTAAPVFKRVCDGIYEAGIA